MATIDHRLVTFGKVTLSIGVLAVVTILAMLHVALVPLRIAAARSAGTPTRSRAERFEELAALGMLGAFLLRLWRPAGPTPRSEAGELAQVYAAGLRDGAGRR